MESILIGATVVGSGIAVYTDLRWRIIPNYLTFPLIGLGVVVHLISGVFRGDVLEAISGGLGAVFAFGIAYALWLTGGWAGGDVKLFTAYGALLPFYEPPGAQGVSYPFFITIFFNSVIIAGPVILTYAIIRRLQGKSVFYEVVRITELEEGMIPAEVIYEDGERVFRKKSTFGLHPWRAKVYADPSRAAGLTRSQILALKKLVREGKLKNELRLKRGMPFGPLLAAGTIVGILYGDLYWRILLSLL